MVFNFIETAFNAVPRRKSAPQKWVKGLKKISERVHKVSGLAELSYT